MIKYFNNYVVETLPPSSWYLRKYDSNEMLHVYGFCRIAGHIYREQFCTIFDGMACIFSHNYPVALNNVLKRYKPKEVRVCV